MNALDLIAREIAKPYTHEVVTTHDDGVERVQFVRSAAQAEMHAIGERRKIGKTFRYRDRRASFMVTSVEVRAK